jgi:hypothetical protein
MRTNLQDKELRELQIENSRLQRELEKARLRDENRRMQEEINRLNWPDKLWPYADPYTPQIIYCANTN